MRKPPASMASLAYGAPANLHRRAKQRRQNRGKLASACGAVPATSIGLAVSTKACIFYRHKTAPPRTETLQKDSHSIHIAATLPVSYLQYDSRRAVMTTRRRGSIRSESFCLLSMPFATKRILRSLDARDLEAEKTP